MYIDSEIGTCSLYEFIYSFRNERNSSFPEITSNEAQNALKMIKKMKNEIASDMQFQLFEDFSQKKLYDGNFIFLKSWYFPSLNYNATYLPGGKENISGSIVGGYNVGINSYINEVKRNASLTVYTYITSMEMQKKLILEKNIISGILKLYDDTDVCLARNCNFFKNIQLVARPTFKMKDYTTYSEKFRKYIYEYLYGNRTALEALNDVDGITKIFYLRINSKDSFMELINLILCFVFTLLMLISLFLLYIKKFKPCFSILSKDFWFISIFGCIITMWGPFIRLGEVKSIKCQLEPLFSSLSFTLTLTPFFFKLFINFPIKNKISIWIKEHKYKFLSLYLLIILLFNGLMMIIPYNTNYKIVSNRRNYYSCKIKNKFGFVLLYIDITFYIIYFILFALLIFLEWNIKETYYDLRFLVSASLIDTISTVLLIIIRATKVDYVTNYIMYSTSFIFMSLNNYFFIYGIKIINAFIKNSKEEENSIIEIIKNNFQNSISSQSSNSQSIKITTRNSIQIKNRRNSIS
eukprot:jgi/Orpsp1_1/1191181/evm.model.d7180000083982.1